MRDLCLILDFGSQYTQLIARRIRELKAYTEIHPHSIGIEQVRRLAPRAIVLSGGPSSAYDAGAPSVDPEIFQLGVPVLGICYGLQLTVKLLGGEVHPSEHREYGRAHVQVRVASPLAHGFREGEELAVWMSHGDRADRLPDGFRVIRATANAPFAIVADEAPKLYGVQFHPQR